VIPDLDDTIVALASAAGPGARGIVRLSGPNVRPVVAQIFDHVPESGGTKRELIRGQVRLPGIYSLLPADLYYSLAPRTYTGQDTAEIHAISSPPLLEAVIAALLNAGARAAQPGEFTMRAFLAGKMDLPRAEAVAGVIEAASSDELKQALGQLAGGVTQPLHGLREDLLNLLADVEAGLDFTDEDIEFVGKTELLLRLGRGLAQLMNLQKQLQERSVSGRPFRVALVGPPNAGKSSLFNAIVGRSAAIVSSVPGTTRDYLTSVMVIGGISIELIDTAGHRHTLDKIEIEAQSLGRNQADAADLLLWCIDDWGSASIFQASGESALVVATKCDLTTAASPGALATSARTGQGLTELKQLLGERARAFARPTLAPSLSRCRHHVDACLNHLRAAHAIVLFDDPAELFALELRLALEQLGQLVGAVYTDDLLDRIFSRFCIGK
jgi:tRNA modification GTPase